MARLVKLTNKPSDNFFAETLVKDLALQARGRGTTAGGAGLAAAFARRLGSGRRLVDGSGLSRGNRASPYRVVRLLGAMLGRDEATTPSWTRCRSPAATARSYDRMRSGPARGRCRGKTGTLSDVSALSGLLRGALRRHLRVLDPDERHLPGQRARAIQDRMAQAIAAVRN